VIIYPAVEMIINQEAEYLMNVIEWEYDQTMGKLRRKGIPINGMDELTNG
jgi:hypothetical protein